MIAPPTFSRCVSSCSALYCATTALTTSLPMEGSTRSSQSVPRLYSSTGTEAPQAQHAGGITECVQANATH